MLYFSQIQKGLRPQVLRLNEMISQYTSHYGHNKATRFISVLLDLLINANNDLDKNSRKEMTILSNISRNFWYLFILYVDLLDHVDRNGKHMSHQIWYHFVHK